MKKLLILILIGLPFLIFGQNQTDSLGRKQGLWIIYYQPYKDFLGVEITRIKERGDYLDDKRIGKWEFYVNTSCYYGVGKTITYYADSGYLIQAQNSNIYVNKDSTFIKSFNTNNPTKYTTCFLNDSGKYECRRVYPDAFNYKKLILDSFEQAIKKVEAIWDDFEMVNEEKKPYRFQRKKNNSD